ncbi:uncharacterized protein EAF02_011740 [Botrytis sinoallii]|uniref:uncharacterized protein n=1 Tax=Botrytis sinoallii TaxID=1463999 RepID=UPI001901999B|nr:uncharacterized protein EAF02_011740 [Botrytis sinoallii]KAF7854122.1 hypothetical protein EAF02_011740 [Botrytis sinoallii]
MTSEADEIDGIAQRTQALHTTLKDLQASLGSLHSNHTSAVTLVAATVASCADNIRTLETTLQKCQLSVPFGTREKICFLGKKAIFPFRQATLQRLENIVCKLQANVDMAIMALQLEVSCKLSEQTSSIVTTSAITTAGIDFIAKEHQSLNASFTHIDAILPTLKDVMDRHLQNDIRSRSLNQYMVQELPNVRMALQDVPEIVEQATSPALNSNQRQLAATVDNTSSKALVPDSDERAFKTSIRKVAKNECPFTSLQIMNDIRGRAYKVDSIGVSLDMDDVTIQIGKMLANGQASLNDVNRRGESILHVYGLFNR